MSAIEIRGLCKSYGSRVGVADVSLAIPAAGIFGFLGPNGAGKTTTIRVLLGLIRPDGGSATILGQDCWSRSTTIKARVGYLPGDLRLYSWMNADSAVRLVGQIRSIDIRHEAHRLLDAFDLDRRVRVKNMSRGMRQKLGLVLALAHRPAVVILDEPTASLDPLMQERLYTELRSLAADGSCVFLSSHTLEEVERLCERVAIIRDGRIVANETVDELRSKARRTVIIRWVQAAPPVSDAVSRLVEFTEQGRQVWRGRLTGSAVELARWCGAQPIADFSIDEPDLSTLFQDFYR